MINKLEIYDMKLLEIEQRIDVFMKQSLHCFVVISIKQKILNNIT